ncbi:hypothetical protein AX15_007678 [Amanita polypyramis BW_CC]|nr:hypothetical protein AX15_007678 [Amanita polypyramis BW_CC]
MSASDSDPPPLAPLDFLQSHRRGSITDPCLHAASSRPPDHPPVSPPSHLSDHTTQLRKLLRSPSLDPPDPRPSSYSDSDNHHRQGMSYLQPPQHANPFLGLLCSSDGDKSDYHADDRRNHQPQFNYNMRRHSIATDQEAHTLPHGTKRKMSADRNGFAPVGEDIDPQLVGPGVPSVMEVDPDVPAPKRRGSAIDSRGLAQLSINERAQSWWPNGRRDPSSILPGTAALGNYNPGAAPDGRLPSGMATFAWPANTQPMDPSDTPQVHNPTEPSTGISRPFDPNMPMMMPPGFTSDRRMSVPAALPPVQTRVLRSRSRPPSRQKQNGANTASTTASSGQEETASSPPTMKLSKESSTPYSRSPELRVSHKLAERKRRKEMKDLFDELRDQLPADRGMKASKWEILSKGKVSFRPLLDFDAHHLIAIDFVTQLKQNHQEMLREIEMLRHELDAVRQGLPPPFPGAPPPHAVVYAHGPGPFSPPPGALQHPPPPQPPPQPQPHTPLSRPSSSQNAFSPGAGPSGPPVQNGAVDRVETSQA